MLTATTTFHTALQWTVARLCLYVCRFLWDREHAGFDKLAIALIQWVRQASVTSEHRRQCPMHYARRRHRRLRPARLMWCSEAKRRRSPTDGLVTACSQTPASSWRPADHSAHRKRTRIHNASLKTSWVVVPVGTWSDSTYNVSCLCHYTI